MYIIGFDYGSKRIGVAVGQTLTATAHPLVTLPVKNQQIDWARISGLIQEWQPDALVVGLPKHADGSDNAITPAVRRFCQQLQKRYQLPVHTIDETLSSVAAVTSPNLPFSKGGIKIGRKVKNPQFSKKDRGNLDAVAAKIIIETWFTESKE
ncbi:MAG: Holliday junction resolvase RuvX [Candidatus Parabeggiatoa sp. nov. 2]|nr:MAG: Holliday junction resolvase RuvX [Beggiatoa sp. 4572_84]RKZ58238.1 MAG: Holliday junction resolvase RuvX [Gammaproteobacteria bacterium]